VILANNNFRIEKFVNFDYCFTLTCSASMRFLFAALLFLMSVVGFSFLAKTLYQGAVEAELEEMAAASLSEAGLSGVTVRFNHHDAKLSGYVDSEDQRVNILPILKQAVPLARVSEEEASSLPIRPTLPPSLLVSRESGSRIITLEGIMGADGDSNRDLLAERLISLEGIENIEDKIEIDLRQLPLPNAAELATLAAELLRESEEARLKFGENGLKLSGQVSNSGRRDTIEETGETDRDREFRNHDRPSGAGATSGTNRVDVNSKSIRSRALWSIGF
jgi:hypothetical protein